MASRILRNETDLDRWAGFLADRSFPMTVSHTKGARRSLPQNATFHKWCSQIAEETGESTASVKAECKLRFGLPIMEAENPDWISHWGGLYEPLHYPMRLRLFEVIPLTSKFTTRQMAAFMDAVQREYRAQGISLIDPDARKYEAEFAA